MLLKLGPRPFLLAAFGLGGGLLLWAIDSPVSDSISEPGRLGRPAVRIEEMAPRKVALPEWMGRKGPGVALTPAPAPEPAAEPAPKLAPRPKPSPAPDNGRTPPPEPERIAMRKRRRAPPPPPAAEVAQPAETAPVSEFATLPGAVTPAPPSKPPVTARRATPSPTPREPEAKPAPAPAVPAPSETEPAAVPEPVTVAPRRSEIEPGFACLTAAASNSPFNRFFELSCEALEAIDVINLKCRGAKGDGTDATEVLTAILDEPGEADKLILIPAGVYLISKTLQVASRTIMGSPQHLGETVIKVADAVAQPLEHMVHARGGAVNLRDITFDANQRAQTGFSTYKNSVLSVVQNVTFKGALGAGVHCDASTFGVLDQVISEKNGGPGFLIEDCSAEALTHITAQNNGGHGVHLKWADANSDRNQAFGSGAYLRAGTIRGNKGHGVVIDGLRGRTVVRDFLIQTQNVGIHVTGETRDCNLVNNRIEKVGLPNAEAKMIRVDSGSSGCLIQENALVAPKGSPPEEGFGVIELIGDHNFVIGNHILDRAEFSAVPVHYLEQNSVIFRPASKFREAPLRLVAGRVTKRSVAFRKAPPQAGKWRADDVILNFKPTEPYGWHCSNIDNEGSCQWTPLFGLSALVKEKGAEP